MRQCYYFLSVVLLFATFSCDKQTPGEAASEVNASVQALIDSVNTDCSAFDLFLSRCSIEKQADSIVKSKEMLFKKKKLDEFRDSLVALDANPSYLALIELTKKKNKTALNAIPSDTWLINTLTNDIHSICKFNSRKSTITLYNYEGNIEIKPWDDVYNSNTNISGYFNKRIFFESDNTILTWAGDSLVRATFRPATSQELLYGTYKRTLKRPEGYMDEYLQLEPDGKVVIGGNEGTYNVKDGKYSSFWETIPCRVLTIRQDGQDYPLYELWRKDEFQPREGCFDVWSIIDGSKVGSYLREFGSEPGNILCLFGVDESYWMPSSYYSSSDSDTSYGTNGSDDWDAILDDYEKLVDNYVSLYKKAMKGDLGALSEYASYMEKAQSISEKLSSAQGSLSSEQLNRYLKITQKMAGALE